MKLSYVLLLSLAAVVAAEHYPNSYPAEGHNSYPEEGHNSYPAEGHNSYPAEGHNSYPAEGHNSYLEEGQSPSNYYTRRQGRPGKKEGIAGLVKRFFGFGATRRQFGGTGTGTGFTGTGTGTGGGQFVGQQTGFAAAPATGGGLSNVNLGLLIFLMALVAAATLAGAIYLATQLNNSGRGLDTDEWEVDHSVWMDQLQKDFEDSWAEN